MADMPPSRAMIAVDVEMFTNNPGAALPAVRQAVREIVPSALQRVGIAWDRDVERCDDSGDGLIVVLRDDRTHRLVDAVYYLNKELRRRRRGFDGPPLRMRVAVHHGPIDAVEGSGTAKNDMCRLLDSEELRQALAGTASYVAAIVSDQVFHTAVRDGFTDLEETDFHRVDTKVKETVLTAWVHVPANDWKPGAGPAGTAGPPAPANSLRPPSGPQSPPAGDVRIGTVNGNAVTNSTVHGGVHHSTTGGDVVHGNKGDVVHGHKGDNVYGDKTVRGA